MRTIAYMVALALMLPLITSCEPRTIYSRYLPVNESAWKRADTVTFCTDTVRHAGRHTLKCGVRLRRNYPYQNLALIIDRQVVRKKRTISRGMERVSFQTITPKGAPTGDGGAIKLIETGMSDMTLAVGDSVVIRVFHIMAREDIPGISDVGITIVNNED